MNMPALIVVDVLKCFFDIAGSAFYPASKDVLPNIEKLIKRARATNTFIVHAVERHYLGVKDLEQKKILKHCEIGTLDAEYVETVVPRFSDKEIEVRKIRYSSFFATDLDLMLRAQGIEEVIIIGVKTNVCIRATAQDAFALGYKVVVPSDATNSNREHLAVASLEDISRYMGDTPTSEQVLNELNEC
jgi:nicotinamidase-related amidase